MHLIYILISVLSINVFDATTIEDAKTIRLAYEANRASFHSHGMIHFRSSTGTASGMETAISGNWSSRTDAQGYCVYAGKLLHEQLYSYADMKLRRGLTVLQFCGLLVYLLE